MDEKSGQSVSLKGGGTEALNRCNREERSGVHQTINE